jgi:uncharacterized protein with HEPN domain
MSDDKKAFLKDILEATRRIKIYTENMEYASFLKDLKTQDAVVRNLEIIGEATKKISEQVRLQAPQIPWKNIARLRDRLIHHYFGVNLDIVWNIVKNDLAGLIDAVETMLSNGLAEA